MNIQKNKTLNQEKTIEILDKTIQSQQEEIKIQKNRTLSQEKKIQSLQDTIKGKNQMLEN